MTCWIDYSREESLVLLGVSIIPKVARPLTVPSNEAMVSTAEAQRAKHR